jgi:molybdopterin-guanine dinucleotide biosynthesis adapter protein
MNVLGFVGHSDSGKTTLLERLIPVFGEGRRVATVKSIHHDVEVDTPGTDTHRHASAGADTVVGVTPTRTFEISREGKRDHPTEVAALRERVRNLERHGYDVVLVEGFRQARCPKVVVGDVVPEGTAPRIIRRVADPDEVDLEAFVADFCDEGSDNDTSA